MKIQLSELELDQHGRAILSDQALDTIEAAFVMVSAAAGSTNTDCTGTNGGCTNKGDCTDTTNVSCQNVDQCYSDSQGPIG